jgi:hypothetical protein
VNSAPAAPDADRRTKCRDSPNRNTSSASRSSAAADAFLPEALIARVSAALLLSIPRDGFRFFGIDPDILLANRLFGARKSDGRARIGWLRDVYLRANDLPYLELPALMSAGIAAAAFHERQEACRE